MDIDRLETICGVRPALLKSLLKRQNFTTLEAMAEFEMPEPAISRTLCELSSEGWIDYRGCRQHVDAWEITEKGLRLCATRLIKRFPVREGRETVAQVIEEARRINADKACSCRITSIVLFGSVLLRADDEDAGDVDLVVEVSRRTLPEAEYEKLRDAEEERMPESLDFVGRLFRVENDLKRRLKRVSHRIALHQRFDLEATGAQHKQVYAYDLDCEAEIEPNPNILTIKPGPDVEAEKRREQTDVQSSSFREGWPVAPNEPVILDHVDAERLRRAQHMWVKGADLPEIAKAAWMSADATAGYLASRSQLEAPPPQIFDASLYRTVSLGVASACPYHVTVRIDHRPGLDPTVETTLVDIETGDHLANIRRFAKRTHVFQGRADLLPWIEPASDLAWFWLQKMRRTLTDVGLKVFTMFPPGGRRADTQAMPKPMDFRPLAPPMLDLLRRTLPEPRSRGSSFYHQIRAELGARIAIEYREDLAGRRETVSSVIRKAEAGELWACLQDFNRRHRDILSGRDAYTIYVSGRQVESEAR